eukprot:tig00001409_g8631.t1
MARPKRGGGDGSSAHGGSQASSWASTRGEAAGAAGEVRVALDFMILWGCVVAAVWVAVVDAAYVGYHVGILAITSATLFAFLVLSYCYALFFYESDPYDKNTMAGRCQSRSELGNLTAQFIVQNILCYTDINQTMTGLLAIGAVAIALWTVVAFYPFYRLWMNQLRIALYCSFLWIVFFMASRSYS